MVGLKYKTQRLASRQSNENFYISINFILVFHGNMLQQLHLPVIFLTFANNYQMRKYHLKHFNLFNTLAPKSNK